MEVRYLVCTLLKSTSMWSKERKIQEEMEMANAISVFAAGLHVSGDIEAVGDIRIEGGVEGNVTANKKIIIGVGGCIKGDIRAEEVCIMGEVFGNIYANGLARFTADAKMKGLIYSGKIEIEAGADMEVSLLKFQDLKETESHKDLKMVKFGKKPVGDPGLDKTNIIKPEVMKNE